MIRRNKDCSVKKNEKPFDGALYVEVTELVSSHEELYGKGRCFAHSKLPVGGEIGFHKHNGECEIYHILSGSGMFNDNGVMSKVGRGDVTITKSGEGHGLKNIGSEPLEFIALILFQ